MPVRIAQGAPREPIDVVLALDNSGSMRANDPQRLMTMAVATFVEQLPPDSRVGLVVFDGVVRVPLGLTPTGEEPFASHFYQALATLDYKGARTDIPGAVERAIYIVRSEGRHGSRRAVILFTDGIIDLGAAGLDAERRGWLHTGLTQEAVQERISIFGIAFTDDADFQLIQSLSRDTDGSHFRIKNASQIVPVFNEIAFKLTAERPVMVQTTTPTAAPSQVSYRSVAGISLIMLTFAGLGLWFGSAQRARMPVQASLTRVASIPEVFVIDTRVVRVGRQAKVRFRRNDLIIDDPRVSKSHAEIHYRRHQFYIRDNSSRNGTFVSAEDGTLVRLKPGKKTPIVKGSRVVFHGHEYIFDCALPRTGGHTDGDETELASPVVAQKCHVCRREVDRETFVKWHRFEVCSTCRDEIDQLSTEEANALERQVDRDLREALTQRM